MQGIADSTSISIWDIRGIQMFPELIKAACSMIGLYIFFINSNLTFNFNQNIYRCLG